MSMVASGSVLASTTERDSCFDKASVPKLYLIPIWRRSLSVSAKSLRFLDLRCLTVSLLSSVRMDGVAPCSSAIEVMIFVRNESRYADPSTAVSGIWLASAIMLTVLETLTNLLLFCFQLGTDSAQRTKADCS